MNRSLEDPPVISHQPTHGILAQVAEHGLVQVAEIQTHAGQQFILQNDVLPAQVRGIEPDKARNILAYWGAQFMPQGPDDKLFMAVALPNGWQKQPAGKRHLAVTDEEGRVRLKVHFEDEIMDRRAVLEFKTRYRYRLHRAEEDDREIVRYAVYDGGKPIKFFEPLILPEDEKLWGELVGQEMNRAWAWLDRHYPGWRNPAAYWDNE